MSICDVTADQFGQVALDLLPRGAAWPRDDGDLVKYFRAVGQVAWRGHQRSCDLLGESFPPSASEMLSDWERVLGLPDPCIGGAVQGLAERRDWVVSRLTAINGQTPAFYIQLAASLGFRISIAEPTPFRAGQSCAGDPVYGIEWSTVWFVTVLSTAQWFFDAGGSAAGDPVDTRPTGVIECLFARLKPAHTTIKFNYGV